MVFSIFKLSLCSRHHSETLFRSVSLVANTSFNVLPQLTITVSSANVIIVPVFIAFTMSFTYNIYNNGPRVLPWGTPYDRVHTVNPRTPAFYHNPKIHKPNTSLGIPPGRPIISGNGCVTEKISALIDLVLNPLVPLIPSYVRDNMHFLHRISQFSQPGSCPDHLFLVTLDVCALYTNILKDEGIKAVREMMKRHRASIEGDLHQLTITPLLRMVLEMNNFEFNGQHYLQIRGTAMGTRVAPTFANIFMAHFENTHVYTYPLQPILWLRFIDDIFMLWTHGVGELQSFHTHLNAAHPTIEFTMEASDNMVHFLDMWVIKEDAQLVTTLYTKPTDAYNFLRFDSAHPLHCRRGIPYGQFLRLRRICTHTADYVNHGLVKANQFLERGYPRDLVIKGLLKALAQDCSTLLTGAGLQPQDPDTASQQILVTTFHPSFKGLGPIVRDNWDTLGGSHKTKFLHDKHLVTGLRRPPNLKSTLVRSRTDYHPSNSSSQDPHDALSRRTYNICTTKECRYCSRLDLSGTITSNTTGRSYSTKTNVSCKSSNLVYCLECTRCHTQYVGQTERKLMARACDHFAKITHSKLDTDMGKHFCNPPHQGLDDVRLYVLDFIHCYPQSATAEKLRDFIETRWIHRLRCLAPLGLNLRDTPKYRNKRA